MKISFIQSALSWENPIVNRQHFQDKIQAIQQAVDIIVLPEMFSTAFTMNPKGVAETMEGQTVSWLKAMASEKNAAICGSVVIEEYGNYFNRLLFVWPSGEIHTYDKRHLFTLAGEDKVYTAGHDKLIIDYKGWKICPLICYDLRFPVFSRNAEDYDLLLFSANWPKPRVNAWDTLLKARAIENLCYVVGVNRIGTDQNGHEYIGHSQVVDYQGNPIVVPTENESVGVVDLDRKSMLEFRKKFAFLDDRDSFKVM